MYMGLRVDMYMYMYMGRHMYYMYMGLRVDMYMYMYMGRHMYYGWTMGGHTYKGRDNYLVTTMYIL